MLKGKYVCAPFDQRYTQKIPLAGPVSALAVCGEDVYSAAEDGLYRLRGGDIRLIQPDMSFTCAAFAAGKVYCSCGADIYAVDGDELRAVCTLDRPVRALSGDECLYILTDKELLRLDEGEPVPVCETESVCSCLTCAGGRVCAADRLSVHRLEGKRNTWRRIFPGHSPMPHVSVRALALDGTGCLWVGCEEGLWLYDYKSGWYGRSEIPQLVPERVNSISFGPDGKVVLGTCAGAVVIRSGAVKYLPAQRYAFSPEVTAAVMAPDGSVYAASQGGIVRTFTQPLTLEEKAFYFFEQTEKYFPRRDGFVTLLSGISGGDPATAGGSRITDNDGLRTQTYLASLCLCYAVTGRKDVLAGARRCKDAMLLLTRVSGIPGFTARAVRYPDEPGWGTDLGSTEPGREWRRTSDGKLEWLGETSSDEMTGHYMGFSLYYDLCADEEEKKEICAAVCAMTDHILSSGGYLIDADGRPTTWGCWDPDELNHDSMWMWEKGLNSLQMLTFLRVSYHMSGNEKYLRRYRELIRVHHFLINAAFHKKADGHSSHIDDNLAMCITLTCLRLEDDPDVRRFILMGLKSHFDYERIEGNPFFDFVCAAFTGTDCDVERCVGALEDIPMSLVREKMINSTRRNVEMSDEPLRWGEPERIALPFALDERPQSDLGIRAFEVDGGDGTSAMNGSGFLLPYWLGRYFGIIE